VLAQLSSRETLFERAISLGGTPILLKPLPLPVTERAYRNVIRALDFEASSVDIRVKKLVSISPEELVAKTPMETPLTPFLDGSLVPLLTSFITLIQDAKTMEAEVPGRKWCKELMFGICQHDVRFRIASYSSRPF
jgi:hypothetical protein